MQNLRKERVRNIGNWKRKKIRKKSENYEKF